MEHSQITCFVGLPVLNNQPISRINHYRQKVFVALLAEKPEPLSHAEIVVIPPFHVEYGFAYGVMTGIGLAKLGKATESRHFMIRGMTLIHEMGENHLVFPVKISDGERREKELRELIQDYRGFLTQRGVSLEHSAEINRPYIVIKKAVTKSQEKGLRSLLLESEREPPIYFNAGIPLWFAKYNEDYKELDNNPNEIDK